MKLTSDEDRLARIKKAVGIYQASERTTLGGICVPYPEGGATNVRVHDEFVDADIPWLIEAYENFVSAQNEKEAPT